MSAKSSPRKWRSSSENYPLFRHCPYLRLYSEQVVKQPDLVLAMFARGDAFADEETARNFAYYEQLRRSHASGGRPASRQPAIRKK